MSGAISRSDIVDSLGVRRSGTASRHRKWQADTGTAHESTADGPPSGKAVLQRASGVARLGICNAAGISQIRELYQQGAFRLRLPRPAKGQPPEVVTINTAGGLTGGDQLDLTVTLGNGAAAVVASQACERIYRSLEDAARIEASIKLGAASRLAWLAQPMIVFDRARIRRTLAVNMAPDASLLAVDGMILGRTAMGEETTTGMIHDGWRICRGGHLVVADAFRAGPDIASARLGPAALNGRRAAATIVYCAPDAEERLKQARSLTATLTADAAASAWNGCLLVRLLAADGQGLTADLMRFLSSFRNQPMPRTWTC